MAGKGVDIRHKLHLSGAGRSTADAARERDHKASMATLIRPYFEQFRRGNAVKSGPVETVIAMMYLAGNGGHEGDRVGLTFGQGCDGAGKVYVIHAHI